MKSAWSFTENDFMKVALRKTASGFSLLGGEEVCRVLCKEVCRAWWPGGLEHFGGEEVYNVTRSRFAQTHWKQRSLMFFLFFFHILWYFFSVERLNIEMFCLKIIYLYDICITRKNQLARKQLNLNFRIFFFSSVSLGIMHWFTIGDCNPWR